MRVVLTAMLTLAAGYCFAGEAVFIVNPSVSVTSIPKQDMENILLGKKTKWDGGGAIKVALMETQGADLLKRITGKSPDQLTNLWKKLVFTGQGSMPKIFKSEAEMVSFVASTPGACGYVSSGTVGGQVKEITVE